MLGTSRFCTALSRFVTHQLTAGTLLRSTAVPSFEPMRRLSSNGNVFEVESVEEFSDMVIGSPVPVLVDFYADWCGPCKLLGPRLEEKVNNRVGQLAMAKVNVDFAGELALDYGVRAVPKIIAFKNGEQIGSFEGVIDDEQIEEFIENAINH